MLLGQLIHIWNVLSLVLQHFFALNILDWLILLVSILSLSIFGVRSMSAGSFGAHGVLVDLDEFVATRYDILSRSHIVISDIRRRGYIRHRSFSEKRLLVVHF